MSALAAALVAAQKAMPKLHKDSEADTGRFQYKYLSLDMLLDQVVPVLNENGLALMQHPSSFDGRHTLVTELRHESGDDVKSVMLVPVGSDATAQAYGSALTYARRYALLSVLALAPDDDDDGAAAQKSSVRQEPSERQQETFVAPPSAAEKPATDGVLTELNTVLKLLNSSYPEHPGEGRTWEDVAKSHIKDTVQKESVRDLSLAEAHELIRWLEDQYQEAAREAAVPFGDAA